MYPRHVAAAATRQLLAPVVLIGLVLGARADVLTAGPSGLPLLTEIKAIRALSQDGGARGYPVRLRGTVTHFDEVGKNSLIIHDGEFGQFVVVPPDPGTVGAWDNLRAGDVVEIVGRTVRGGFAPNVEPQKVRVLGRAPMPPPRKIPYSALLTGRHDCDVIEIDGVVQRTWLSSDVSRTRLMFAEVATQEGRVRAAFWEYTSGDLAKFIDARVRLHGNVGTIFGQTEQLRGVSLFAGRTGDLELLEPAPDPFALPVRPSRGIYNYSSAGEVNRRIRVNGVVTAVVPGHPVEVTDFTTTATFRYVLHVLYVKDSTGGIRIETEQTPNVKPGQLVEAAGFPGVTPGRPILRNSVFKIVGAEVEPAPVPIPPENVLTPDHDAELVRMEGQLLSVLTGPTERVLVLRSGETVFNAGLDISEAERVVDRVRPGSVVSVTGVYSYQGGPPPWFRLYVRTADDVSVLAAAPWWTLQHTAVMVMMLIFVAGIGGVGMRAQARRKRAEYQAVLTERIRVARELHDTLEQGLAGIALQIEAVAGSLKTSPDNAHRSLDIARQMLRYSLEETRRSVMDLRSQALETRDLAGALGSLARQMTVGTRAEATVHVTGVSRRLDAAEEHHLLRIGLEALTNALKHADPVQIDIELSFGPAATTLVVRDDGRGLGHGADDVPGDHFGLQGVRERADKLGGLLQIDSQPGKGTRLAVTVPLRHDHMSRAGSQPVPQAMRDDRLKSGEGIGA
ncbi:MAG: histidine kinase [Longimicrobiales bacterium]